MRDDPFGPLRRPWRSRRVVNLAMRTTNLPRSLDCLEASVREERRTDFSNVRAGRTAQGRVMGIGSEIRNFEIEIHRLLRIRLLRIDSSYRRRAVVGRTFQVRRHATTAGALHRPRMVRAGSMREARSKGPAAATRLTATSRPSVDVSVHMSLGRTP
jgi:hypothetical protein